jgi:nucleoside-diphosphate-sugar epimerase
VRVLVLGGSWFVGTAVVEQAVSAGYEVTVFNRGRTPARFPDGVRLVRGDREDPASLAALATHGPWDTVIDVAGSVPAVVRDSARALAAVADRYAFVSTVSVYRDWPGEPVTETSPMHPADPDEGPRQRVPGTFVYGQAKAGCEAAIAREFPPERRLMVRPGVVLGPGEYVGRVPWWLSRMRRGGRVLAPGRPDRGIQPIDVRDLARFLVDLTGQGGSGVMNVAPPEGRETYGGLLSACADAVGASPDITWVDEAWLAEQGVRQWTELPLWRTARGTWAVDARRAASLGLTCRPLAATVADVWAWWSAGGRPVAHERWAQHGLDAEKETRLLAAWDDLQAAARRG